MVLLHTADNLNLFQWKFAYLSMASHLTQNKTEGPYYGLQALHAVTLTTSWPYFLLSSPVHSIPDNWPLRCFWNIPKYTRLRASVLFFPCAQNTFSRNAYVWLAHLLPSAFCSKIILCERNFSITLHKTVPLSCPPVILYPLSLPPHIFCIFLKKSVLLQRP